MGKSHAKPAPRLLPTSYGNSETDDHDDGDGTMEVCAATAHLCVDGATRS